jgi:superfamily II DNA or RNA helicase
LSSHSCGVLSATTGFGKTVIGSAMIQRRQTNTLIIVHRKQLLEQWKESLAVFLDCEKKEIGIIGGGKHKPSG